MVQVIEAEVYERWETMRAACGLLMMSQGLVRNESHRKVVVENDEGDTEVEDQHHETNIQWENEVAGVGKKSTARGGTLDSGGNRDAPYDQPIRISKPSCARNCKHVSRRSGKKADLAPQTPPNRAENDDTDTSPAPATVEEALQPKKIIIRLRLPKPKPKRKLEEVENGEVKKGEKKRKRK